MYESLVDSVLEDCWGGWGVGDVVVVDTGVSGENDDVVNEV